ncbi:MAG: NAD(P)H-hydrate dehydratase [Gemmiger sp.]|nr:NAD(P)H-hydrate dehydratase [Gemmiger sp.]
MQNITAEMVWDALPTRRQDANKGSYGRVVAVAGSARYRGAAALCVEGALRIGAGLVYLAAVEAVLPPVLARTPECCVLPCPATPAGGVEPAALADALRPFLPGQAGQKGQAVLLAGPGLGSGAGAVLAPLLNGGWQGLVLDADALNALAADDAPHAGADSGGHALPPRTVITPHPGEAARLLHTTVAAVQAGRAEAALTLAEKYCCVAVLKGSGTLIATPEGGLWRNDTGNPGLARGGAGDVLAGMIAGLLAQGLPPLDAARCGVWLHGAAADRCALRRGMQTMLPQDLFEDLGYLFAERGR